MKCLKTLVAGALFALMICPANYTYADLPPVNVSVTASGRQPGTSIVFNGFTSQSAFITFMDNGIVVGTATANLLGSFTKTLTNQTPGSHSFSIGATDLDGRSTNDYGFIINLQVNTETVVSNILLPTTLEVQTGVNTRVLGNATPNTTITIFVHSSPFTETFGAGWNGIWDHTIGGLLDPGSHTVYGRVATEGGLQSINSNTETFDVSCGVADLDCNGAVDLVDFSILMYYWGTDNATADINNDNIVDLTDFSIMMYYWTG